MNINVLTDNVLIKKNVVILNSIVMIKAMKSAAEIIHVHRHIVVVVRDNAYLHHNGVIISTIVLITRMNRIATIIYLSSFHHHPTTVINKHNFAVITDNVYRPNFVVCSHQIQEKFVPIAQIWMAVEILLVHHRLVLNVQEVFVSILFSNVMNVWIVLYCPIGLMNNFVVSFI